MNRQMIAQLMAQQNMPPVQPQPGMQPQSTDLDPFTGLPARDILAEERQRAMANPLMGQADPTFRPPVAPAPGITPDQFQTISPAAQAEFEKLWGSGY